MVVAGLILLAIGAVDLLRHPLRGRVVATRTAIGAVALSTGVAAWGCGVEWHLLGLIPAIGIAWGLWVPADGRIRLRSLALLPIGALSLIVIATTFLVPPATAPGWLGGLWRVLPHPVPIAGPLLVLGAGVLVFLLESSNVVVRAALRSEVLPTGADEDGDAGATATGLRGGRLIGPVERLLVAGLALAGAFTAIGALIAAKGIVRFPEINKDPEGTENRSRAEYFLVGTIMSWGLAFAGAALIYAAALAI